MPQPERRPPVKMTESTEPHSIRFTPSQWAQIQDAARQRMEEPSRLVRRLTMYALSIIQAQALAPEYVGLTGTGRL